MRGLVLALAVMGLGIAGCQRGPVSTAGGEPHGRYTGVGIYNPSKQWTRLAAAQPSTDPQAARLVDDQVVIVVQDSVTGEVRACGDLSGYCIGMNPWKTALTAGQVAPVRLTEHRAPDPDVQGDASGAGSSKVGGGSAR